MSAITITSSIPELVVYFSAMLARRFFVFVAAVLVVAACRGYAADEEGQPAPRFHAKTLNGETFTNQSTKGKVVLLQFWTTWCPYCKKEQSLVDSIDHEFAAKDVVVLAIDVAESKKKVKQYLQESPRSCRIVLTEDTNLAAMYQANSYPIYVVIDRDGNIAAEQRGAGGERSLRRMLRKEGVEADPEKED
jgi:thiol-disulfide isomerase/thioredoxin